MLVAAGSVAPQLAVPPAARRCTNQPETSTGAPVGLYSSTNSSLAPVPPQAVVPLVEPRRQPPTSLMTTELAGADIAARVVHSQLPAASSGTLMAERRPATTYCTVVAA